MDDLTRYHPNPSKPRFTPPAGAVDSHCHVFGPAADFPFAPSRKYTPHDAGKAALFALRDHLGFTRNVIVQATCHGTDNSAVIDAIEAANGRARGVAVVAPDVSDAELDALHEGGIRGVRFNFLKRLVDDTPAEVYAAIAARVAKLGWHLDIYFEAEDLTRLTPFITSLPGVVVIDHMARPDIAAGVAGAGFQQFLALLEAHENLWVKVSCPERLSLNGADYSGVIPFARMLVERFPSRVLWGSDWPHPNMHSHMPDDGALVDVIPEIAPTKALQKALLVDNPMRLFWKD